jgi:DNA topoisomerase-2
LCTAYIAEGLSAKAFITRGISSIPFGQDLNGAFAVKGKFLNVQNATSREINKNEEVQQLKLFLGLRQNMDYTKEENVKTLRYGKVCILTDADDDGIHIRGLLLNFFYKEHPGLIEQGYVDSFSTAVAAAMFKGASKSKSQKGTTTNPGKLLFYSNPEFKKWYNSDEAQKIKSMDVKYYKGLGSINPKDAPAYFKNKKEVNYFMEGNEKEFMDLGFNKEFSDARKEWITKGMDNSNFHTEGESLEEGEEICSSSDEIDDDSENLSTTSSTTDKPIYNGLDLADFVYEGKLGLSSFVNDQLVIYHRMALRRALPSVWDGLKESQRKVLFTVLLRNYKKTSDLEKIMGAVKEETKYHHGGSSVTETITKMGQGFVGSNNIPLLENDGEFGTRINGGGDHAAPRYIATMAEKITRIIFSVHDDALLERMIEDNEPIEYRFYMPILPMILVNGVKGIASGYSTDIPSYNPLDLVHWIEMWLDGKSKSLSGLVPWYRGYTGEIKLEKFVNGRAGGWISKGILEEGNGKEAGWWHIRELPIGTWTKSFEEWLEYIESGVPPKDKKWKKKEVRGLHDIKSYCTPNKVHFMIQPTKDFIPDMNIAGNLKVMQSTKSLNNMVAIDENDYPRRFGSPEEILRFFCPMRLKYYGLRKECLLTVLKRDLLISSNRYRFVKGVVDKKLDLHHSDEELEMMLSSDLWHFNKVESGQNKELSYDYLLSMQMRSMTVKKLEELKLEANKLTEEIRILESKTVKDIWRDDLSKFKTEYVKFLKTRCEE